MIEDPNPTGAPPSESRKADFAGKGVDNRPGEAEPSQATANPAVAPSGGDRVAFCQQCGRPLTRETVRRVGAGVFCEPCLEQRIGMGAAQAPGAYVPQSGAAWQAPGAPGASSGPPPGSAGGAGAVPPSPSARLAGDDPSPGLAALLGLIPGVGAMYNGQFAKGVVHLTIFAMLVSLSNNVSDIFGMFVAGWIFYQSFEAYHTAKARRDGLPLPDPFGLNDIGDRLNFGNRANQAGVPLNPIPPVNPAATGASAYSSAGTWPGGSGAASASGQGAYSPQQDPGAPVASEAAQDYGPAAAYGPPSYSVPPAATAPPSVGAPSIGASWLGYAPPTAFATGPVAPVAPYRGAAQPAAPFAPAPVPYTGVAPVAPMAQADDSAGPIPEPHRGLPASAFWLIGLGIIVLLFNLVPGWRLSPSWVAAALLTAVAIWSLLRQVSAWGDRASMGLAEVPATQWVHAARLPAVLFTLAVLLALQAARILTMGQSWPLLLIVLGGFLLLERLLPMGFGTDAAAYPYKPAPMWTDASSAPRTDAAAAQSSGNADSTTGAFKQGNGGGE